MTNREWLEKWIEKRLGSLSDEELVDFITDLTDEMININPCMCCFWEGDAKACLASDGCKNGRRKWLQAEHKEGDKNA